MTARAKFTVAQIAQAIRAAAKAGHVAVYTDLGIAFVPPETVVQTAPVSESGGNTCDDVFGRGSD